MITATAIEVNLLIYPAFFLFVMALLPIPFISRRVCKFIATIENIRFQGISILMIVTIGAFILFGLSMKEYRDRFTTVSGEEQMTLDTSRRADQQFHAKKWRAERNLYVHAMVAVLYSSLLKIARLTLENMQLHKKVTKVKQD